MFIYHSFGSFATWYCRYRILAMNFFLSRKVLYKRNHAMVLIRCVDVEEAKQIMIEIHEGICGTHANEHMMARQILRSCYY